MQEIINYEATNVHHSANTYLKKEKKIQIWLNGISLHKKTDIEKDKEKLLTFTNVSSNILYNAKTIDSKTYKSRTEKKKEIHVPY